MEGVHYSFALCQHSLEFLKRPIDDELNGVVEASGVLVAELCLDSINKVAAVVCGAVPRNTVCIRWDSCKRGFKSDTYAGTHGPE